MSAAQPRAAAKATPEAAPRATATPPHEPQSNRRRLTDDERTHRAQQRRAALIHRQTGRILDAIALCFAERGYHETSVDQVVQRARMSKSAFYACFPNKELAFAALLEREGERLLHAVEQAIVDEPQPSNAARAGIATFVADCARNRDAARILLVESVGISPVIEERRRALHARFAEMIRAQAEASGRQPQGIDLEVIAYALVGAVNEAVVRLLETGRRDPTPVVDALGHLAARTLQP
ncbi:MAG TPA: TetR/AcrR family transcriptional regulator [Candidatus Dormibacteraeota bacterium]|nr:TetR/AcrR family transcriptional regulator [Candidatus Dormibacteraeota bacterium]